MATDVISDVIQTSDLPDTQRVIYSSELEHTSRGNVIYDQFAERKNDFSGQKGTTITWTTYQNLPPAIKPLVEDQDVQGMQVADFQTSLTVEEYGTAIGTTEKLNLTSYHGSISGMVQSMLAPHMALTMDILARNSLFDPLKATYRTFAGGNTARSQLDSSDVMTSTIARAAAFQLSTRRIPPTPQGYIAVVHPAQIYDLRLDEFWIDVLKYTQPDTILNGEVGKIHGVRFIEAHNARLPNAGTTARQTTIAGATPANRDYVVVADATGFAAGQEVTLHRHSSLPDGTDETEEHLVVKAVTGTTNGRISFRSKITINREAGDYVTDGVDIFPTAFMGATKALGRGAVLEPEVRVALPTDKLRRQYHVGWYGLFGYGVIRDWALELVEMSASVNAAPAFPW